MLPQLERAGPRTSRRPGSTRHQATLRAARLENSANALTAAAGRVEQAQHQWESRLNHLRNDAVHNYGRSPSGTRL